VHELAKELKLGSKELIQKLSGLGVSVKSHMSSLDNDTVALVKEELASKKETSTTKEKPVLIETPEPAAKQPVPEKKLRIELPITAKELALRLNIKPNQLISNLISDGIFVSINQDLKKDIIESVLYKYGFALEEIPVGESLLEQMERKYNQPDNLDMLVLRPPVVTLMGHVDHGKTLLLDTIRRTKVIDTEYGGITQHIGAYEVNLPDGKIVFLDTPGHEAFTAMRARGANITDIAVVVIAADEGVMPQTLEAIDHAKAANVPIVIAINKVDKPTANPERVKRQLNQHGIKVEGWGGDIICCEVSAMAKTGIEHFLEMVLLQAELLELKANPNKKAYGTVIESRLTSNKGPIAALLVRNGTLKLGDPVLCGMYSGKVKALINDTGKQLAEAGPSTPVEILGLSGSPDAGSQFYVTETEREAKEISAKLQARSKRRTLENRQLVTLEEIYDQMSSGLKELKLIIKGDVQGSVEALSLALEQLGTDKITVSIIHSGVGDITENDVTLAIASSAIIIGFHVRANQKIKDICRKKMVDLRLYNIIYQAAEEIRAAMEGTLEPKIEEHISGRAKIRQIFRISKVGMIAGCIVIEGKITRNAKARIIREDKTIYENQIVSLKRLKDEVKETAKGFECGLRIGGFQEYQAGDIVETYVIEKKKQTL